MASGSFRGLWLPIVIAAIGAYLLTKSLDWGWGLGIVTYVALVLIAHVLVGFISGLLMLPVLWDTTELFRKSARAGERLLGVFGIVDKETKRGVARMVHTMLAEIPPPEERTPDQRELADRIERYFAKNPELRHLEEDWTQRLSADDLSDVPAIVRVGSPKDADAETVALAAADKGELHAQTNYAVVYRVAFAPSLLPGEEPLADASGRGALRFGFVASGVKDGADSFVSIDSGSRQTDPAPGWILATSRGMRWHYVRDGVPGLSPERPRRPGARDVPFEGSKGGIDRTESLQGVLLFRQDQVHEFWLMADPSNQAFFELVLTRLGYEL